MERQSSHVLVGVKSKDKRNGAGRAIERGENKTRKFRQMQKAAGFDAYKSQFYAKLLTLLRKNEITARNNTNA